MDAAELGVRIGEVKSDLAVGMAEIKGSLALLVQGAENDRRAAADERERVTREFARRDAERQADRTAQEKKDADQEARLRAVDGLPATVRDLQDSVDALRTVTQRLTLRIAGWGGGIAVLVVLAGWGVEWALFHH